MFPRLLRTTTPRRLLSTVKTIPKPTDRIPDVNRFLTIIGRNCNELADTYENNWSNLFTWDSRVLKEKGVPVQQRRYILLQVEKFRQEGDVVEYKKGKKSFFGGERKRKERRAKWEAEQRQLRKEHQSS